MRRTTIRRAAAALAAASLLMLAACDHVKIGAPSYGYDESYIPFGRD